MRRRYISAAIVKERKEEKNTFLLFWEKIHKYLGSIILFFTIWSILFFLVPYFMYYKFLPLDKYLINSNIIFILVVIVFIFFLLLVFPAFFLYISLTTYMQIENKVTDRDLFLSIITGTSIIDFFLFIGWLKNHEDAKIYIWFAIIFMLLGIIYYFILKALKHAVSKRIEYKYEKRSKSKKEIIASLIISYFAFIVFLILCSTIITALFLTESIKNIFVYIILLFISIFIYYALVFFFIDIDAKNKLLFMFVLILITPFMLIIIFTKEYINRLFVLYSHFGLTSNKNIILLRKDIYDVLPQNISRKLPKCKNFRFYNKNYICLEDIKIIWNDSEKIFINVEDKSDSLIFPIHKSFLFNKDFIRKRNYKTSNKESKEG